MCDRCNMIAANSPTRLRFGSREAELRLCDACRSALVQLIAATGARGRPQPRQRHAPSKARACRPPLRASKGAA